MKGLKRTTSNPHGLTVKETLTIEDMVAKVKHGKALNPVESTKKFYMVKDDASARSLTSQLLRDEDFRAALIEGLHDKEIIGKNSKVEKVLEEGLGASTPTGEIDHRVRLDYAKEINKITGVYAPERKETISAHLTEKQVGERIRQIKEELDDVATK